MGLKKFQIVFDNPWATYYSGQPVTGKVIISVDTPKKIRALVIHIKGEAQVKWDETRAKKNAEGATVNETTVHSGSEQYFENKFNLLGGSGNEVFIQPGEQTYPFSTFLPPNLPSSFEGEFGYVRYTVKAILDRPWKFDQDTKAAFTVISPVDLNTHETAKNPVKMEKEKFFCCLCCKSGPATLVLSLPVGGYVPGQAIPVTVEMDNTSNVEVTLVKCILRKVVTFRATLPAAVKKDKITIAEHSFGAVAAGGSQTWTEHLVIPPLPPSNLQNCNIIDLEYDLKVEAKVSGVLRNFEVKTPIILGTIPLLSYQPPIPVAKPAEMNGGDGKDPNASVIPGGPSPQWGPPAGQGDPAAYPQQPPQWGANVPPVTPQGPWVPPGGDPNAPPGGQADPSASPAGYPQQPPAAGYPQQPPAAGYPQQPPAAGYPQQPPAAGYPQQPLAAGYPQQPGVPGAPSPGQPAAPQWGPGPPVTSPQQPSAPSALYPTLPFPSFAESSVGGSKNIQDAGDSQFTQGNLQFTPKYPVYNFQPVPQPQQ
ncbi:arrestin domain-containing protein 17 [Anabrus simplex]|uniref:arrestin domain-containing protein 17 n=1 Tax=Anabrus simplex TaxID=316456 RepID=UPI0034DCE8C4